MNDGQPVAEHPRRRDTLALELDERVLGLFLIMRIIFRVARGEKADAAHSQRFTEDALGGIASRPAGTPSFRIVCDAQELRSRGRRLRRILTNAFAAPAATNLQSAVIAFSGGLASRRARDAPNANVVCIANGIDGTFIRAAQLLHL